MERELLEELSELVFLSIDDGMDEEKQQRLEELLEQSSLNRKYYFRLINTYLGVQEADNLKVLHKQDQDVPYDIELWKALSVHEETASAIHMEKPLTVPDEPQPIKPARLKHKTSRFSIFVMTFSAAAMLLFAAVIFFTPVYPVVATLTDSIDAEWINTEDVPVMGDSLREGEMTLAKGFAEITFDDGAVVVVEAPSIIEFESPKSMFLASGKISAVVSEYAIGFTVNTPNGSVIDFGTEFGVEVDTALNKTEAHVFTGLIELHSSSELAKSKTSEKLKAGMAASVKDGSISKIYKAVPERYVKKMPSEYEMAIRNSNPKSYWRFAESLTNILGDKKFTGHIEGKVDYKDIVLNSRESVQAISIDPYKFDGQINYGNVLDPGSDSFTVSMWFKPSSLEGKRRQFLISKRGLSKGWSILNIGNDIMFRTTTRANEHVWIGNKNSLTTGWHHVVMVIDRQTNKIRGFLDGSEEGWSTQTKADYFRTPVKVTTDSYQVGTSIYSDQDLLIGNYISASPDDILSGSEERKSVAFHGLIFDVAVWKRVLNKSEIQKLYNSCSLSGRN